MLQITIPATTLFNEDTCEFIYVKEQTISLEHSLVSLSKWESKWCKPFLSSNDKTQEQTIDYVRCMTLTQNVDPNSYMAIPNDVMNTIAKYIEAPMTATWFAEDKSEGKKSGKTTITSELIYYWMISLNIPFECQKWHLNRLLTLIRVCNEKNKPPKKMGKREAINRQKALNEQRRAALRSKG